MSADTKPVAELAYELWVARGRPQGSGIEDWVEAERQLAAARKGSLSVDPPKEPAKPLVSPQGPGPSAKIPKPKQVKKEPGSLQQSKRQATAENAEPGNSAKQPSPRNRKGPAG
jgi:hypothetical protein